MKEVIKLAAVATFIIASTSFASATVTSDVSALQPLTVVYGQEECKEGEKYNEETKKCEKQEG